MFLYTCISAILTLDSCSNCVQSHWHFQLSFHLVCGSHLWYLHHSCHTGHKACSDSCRLQKMIVLESYARKTNKSARTTTCFNCSQVSFQQWTKPHTLVRLKDQTCTFDAFDSISIELTSQEIRSFVWFYLEILRELFVLPLLNCLNKIS